MLIKNILYALLGCVVTSITGCSGDNPLAGSCMTGKLGDNSVICINYSDADKVSQWQTACKTMMKGQWSTTACETSSALGGCRAGNKLIWYYPSEKHVSVEQVQQACANKGRVFVFATTGKPDLQ